MSVARGARTRGTEEQKSNADRAAAPAEWLTRQIYTGERGRTYLPVGQR